MTELVQSSLCEESKPVATPNICEKPKKKIVISKMEKFFEFFGIQHFSPVTTPEEMEMIHEELSAKLSKNFSNVKKLIEKMDCKILEKITNKCIEFWNVFFNEYFMLKQKLEEIGDYSNIKKLYTMGYIVMMCEIFKFEFEIFEDDRDILTILNRILRSLKSLNFGRSCMEKVVFSLCKRLDAVVLVQPPHQIPKIPEMGENERDFVVDNVSHVFAKEERRDIKIKALEISLEEIIKAVEILIKSSEKVSVESIETNGNLLLLI